MLPESPLMLVNRAIIIGPDNTFLLLRRRPNSSYFPGYWEIPGGKLEIGQDVSHALEREIMEETGLVIMPTHKLAYVDSFYITSGKHQGALHIAIISIAKSVNNSQVILSSEHTEFSWMKYEQILKLDDIVEQSKKAFIVLHDLLHET